MEIYTYEIRGRMRKVTLIENGLAFKVKEKNRTDSSKIAKELGKSLFTSKSELTKKIDAKELTAFKNAGWYFIDPKAAVSRDLEEGKEPKEFETCGKVYIDENDRLKICTNELSIQFKEVEKEEAILDLLQENGLEIVMDFKFAKNLFTVKITDGTEPLKKVLEMVEMEEILVVEPNFVEQIGTRFTPTDPQFSNQWQWANDGSGGGVSGADISAEEAWDFTRGAGVTVGIIENGFDVAHTDISPALTGQSGFFNGASVFSQGTPATYPVSDHGTFVAGMVGARANNGSDGVGVANQALITAVACLGDQIGTQATMARAIAYAANPTTEVAGANAASGAQVITCSLGPAGANWTMTNVLQLAIDAAVNNGRGGLGCPVFWASSNSDVTIDGADGTDEVCAYANTIAVGRSSRSDLHDNSSFGPELEFLAPGVDVRSTAAGGGTRISTGTSFAAPCAAGVGALVIGMNPDLTWQEVRNTLRNTCDKIGGDPYVGGRNDRYGFGRVNAAMAVCEAGRIVDLATPSISFNDIPESETTARAVVFNVRSCLETTFQVIDGPNTNSGPAGSFALHDGPIATVPSATDFNLRQANLWLRYTGTDDGDIASGDLTIRCNETTEEWTININANTVSRPSVAVALVLDKSGSMDASSGITVAGLQKRIDVLRYSALPLIDLIQEGNGISVTAFDQDPHTLMNMAPVGDPNFGVGRVAARNAITSHIPNLAGMTAIGDGVETGINQLNSAAAAPYDVKAMIVLTDGHETAGKYVADVTDQLSDEHVFAIGLGTADVIQPNALNALTNNTGGYLLMTGNMGNDDIFRLTKYYLQILAGVTNTDIVLDPEGTLFPGDKHRIPFYLNETDISSDIILLCPNPNILNFHLETPDGDKIDPVVATSFAGITHNSGSYNAYYRVNLPVPIGSGARSGKWIAVLSLNKKGESFFDKKGKDNYSYNNDNPNYNGDGYNYLAKGIPYSLNVHAYSNIRMNSNLYQSSNEPGAAFTIRTVFSEYGNPMEGVSEVRAELVRPDGTKINIMLNEVATGEFEANHKAIIPGVYKYLIKANGNTSRGRLFTREQIVTGAVWKGGDAPFPGSGTGSGSGSGSGSNDPSSTEFWCHFFKCLFSKKVISEEYRKHLKGAGFDIDQLNKCLEKSCRKGSSKPHSLIDSLASNLIDKYAFADINKDALVANITSAYDLMKVNEK